MDVSPERFSKLGQVVFGVSEPEKCIEAFEAFFRSINMPIDIKGLGLDFGEKECMTAAKGVTFNDARKVGNFKSLNTDDLYEIYKMASGIK